MSNKLRVAVFFSECLFVNHLACSVRNSCDGLTFLSDTHKDGTVLCLVCLLWFGWWLHISIRKVIGVIFPMLFVSILTKFEDSRSPCGALAELYKPQLGS
jgi:hypothetical protein